MRKYQSVLDFIAESRARLKLSERALCMKAGCGVDAIRLLRRGHAPRYETLAALAAALGAPVDRLTRLVDGREPAPDLDSGLDPLLVEVAGAVYAALLARTPKMETDRLTFGRIVATVHAIAAGLPEHQRGQGIREQVETILTYERGRG